MKEVLIPQEVEVWYIIPAIRRELAKAMQASGMKQKEMAKSLRITEAAISQYLSDKRASEIKFDAEFKAEIKKSASKIIKDSDTLLAEIQRLLSILKKEKFVCKVHKMYCSLPSNCDLCYK